VSLRALKNSLGVTIKCKKNYTWVNVISFTGLAIKFLNVIPVNTHWSRTKYRVFQKELYSFESL
jgi:hypothetical protein